MTFTGMDNMLNIITWLFIHYSHNFLSTNCNFWCLSPPPDRKYAPRCSVCGEPIMPDQGQEETVRIVALDRSFHVNCYVCEVSQLFCRWTRQDYITLNTRNNRTYDMFETVNWVQVLFVGAHVQLYSLWTLWINYDRDYCIFVALWAV